MKVKAFFMRVYALLPATILSIQSKQKQKTKRKSFMGRILSKSVTSARFRLSDDYGSISLVKCYSQKEIFNTARPFVFHFHPLSC